MKKTDSTEYLTVTLNSTDHEEINKHLLIINGNKQKKVTKGHWLMEAVEERLKSEDIESFIYEKTKSLNLIVSAKIKHLIEERVIFIKKFKKSYSKTKWIQNAVKAKLKKESIIRKNFEKEFSKIK